MILAVPSHRKLGTACFRVGIALVLTLAMPIVVPFVVEAKSVRRGPDLLASLHAGQWVRLRGTPQKNSAILCSEVKLLTGDFFDEDWSVMGRITKLDLGGRSLRIGPFFLTVSESAVFEKPLRGLTTLRVGMVVEADGTYTRDGTFVAKELDEESHEDGFGPGTPGNIQIVARVDHVDVARRRITAMKTVFQVGDNTQLKSAIQ